MSALPPGADMRYPIFSKDCLDRWLNDFEDFRYDFLFISHQTSKALGYELQFHQKELEIAHASWKASHDIWLELKVKDSTELSHIKIAALLLHHLSSVDWVKALLEYNGDSLPLEDGADIAEFRADLNAGRGPFLAYNFVIQTINWFEERRTDKIDAFEYRMTNDLESDFLHYLLSAEKSEMAIYLILKALYVRD